MTFRRRIALLAGLSFVAAVLACSLTGYIVVRREMLAQIDNDLMARVIGDPLGQSGIPPAVAPPGAPGSPGSPGTPGPPDAAGGPDASAPSNTAPVVRRGPALPNGVPPGRPPPRPTDVWTQTVSATGAVTIPDDQTARLPVDDAERALAEQPPGFSIVRDVTVDGTRLRMITASTGQSLAIQIARPLTEVDQTLSQFAKALIMVSIAGSVMAAGVGWFVARRAARPVTKLTAAAEHVAETLEFDTTLSSGRKRGTTDEISRLTASIAAMLDALRLSRQQQRRLVMDASHEFRTPLTSLRTNVELLSHPDIDEATRAEIVTDLRAELEELTDLSIELVQLATDTHTDEPATVVDMRALADRVAERATKRTGHLIQVEGDDWQIEGHAAMLERAVHNLVDNACKWNKIGEAIVVHLEPGRIDVSDHGPGIPEAERDLIFDRFYRAEAARTTPGSGLGLAIVRQIVADHGGAVSVSAAVGGGARFSIRIPTTNATANANANATANANANATANANANANANTRPNW